MYFWLGYLYLSSLHDSGIVSVFRYDQDVSTFCSVYSVTAGCPDLRALNICVFECE